MYAYNWCTGESLEGYGTGDTFSGRSSTSWNGGHTHAGERFNGKYRQATVTGSLVFDGQQRVGADGWGEIQNASAGSHVVSRY